MSVEAYFVYPLKTSPFEESAPTENPYTPNTVTNIRGSRRDCVGEKNIKWLYEFQYGTQCRLFIQCRERGWGWRWGGGLKEKHVGNMGDWLDIDFLVELWGEPGRGCSHPTPTCSALLYTICDEWGLSHLLSYSSVCPIKHKLQ